MITIIAALDAEYGIGCANALPWHLPADMAHFKRTTMGKPLIMGRKTYDSIGRPLPGRFNAVLSRTKDLKIAGCSVFESLDAALHFFRDTEEVIVMGGADVYAQAMAVADRMIITHVKSSFLCDAFFPPIYPNQWIETAREEGYSLENGYGYAFVTYKRCQPKE